MRKVISIALFLMAGIGRLAAQQVTVEGSIAGSVPEGLCLYVAPVTVGQMSELDTLHISGGKFQGNTRQSPWNIYHIIVTNLDSRAMLPVALFSHEGKVAFTMVYDGDDFSVADASADNMALHAFGGLYATRAKQLWMEGKDMDATTLRRLVMGYPTVADSIIASHGVSQTVADYLQLWAASVTFDAINGLRSTASHRLADVGLDGEGQMDSLCADIDCDLAATFTQVPHMVLASLPQGTLDDRLAALYARYRNSHVRQSATALLLSRQVSTFPYADRYAEWLAELKTVTEKYGLDRRYINEFEVRKASIVGAPFPDAVTLYDLQGNEVDFSKYRGKYVYMDMWASWCVPCIREIPHLRNLEATLQNPDVVFLSVNVDKAEDVWKRKVEELSLPGNQLIDPGNQLTAALNVRSIPFFIIYDREGKLYKYNAYRPSDARLPPLLEQLK